jgi:hypothetical protein
MGRKYQVRFRHDGTVRYGVVSLGAKNVPAGHLLVSDAVYPRSYYVLDEDAEAIEFSMGRLNEDGYFWGSDAVHDYMSLASMLHNALEPAGRELCVGRQFSCGVADGSAYYVITRVKRVNVDVEWRGFQGDRYIDRLFGWGGTFRKVDVERYIRGEFLFRRGDVKKLSPVELFRKYAADFKERFGELPQDISDGLSKLIHV